MNTDQLKVFKLHLNMKNISRQQEGNKEREREREKEKKREVVFERKKKK